LISYIDFDEVGLKLNFKKNKVNIPTIKRIVSVFSRLDYVFFSFQDFFPGSLFLTSKRCFDLTSSVLLPTLKLYFEQSASSFLACSLIFIEYMDCKLR